MIRYREGKIVSTKGERFSQVTKEESEEMKKSIVNINFIIWLLFHSGVPETNHKHSTQLLIALFSLTLHFARGSEQKIWQFFSSIILIWCWCPFTLLPCLLATVSCCLDTIPRLKVSIISLYSVPFYQPQANINSFKICQYSTSLTRILNIVMISTSILLSLVRELKLKIIESPPMLFSDIILLLQFAFHCKSIYQKRNVWHLVSDDLECSRFIRKYSSCYSFCNIGRNGPRGETAKQRNNPKRWETFPFKQFCLLFCQSPGCFTTWYILPGSETFCDFIRTFILKMSSRSKLSSN